MLLGSIKLGRAFGIDVQIHWSFLLLPLAIIAMSVWHGDAAAHIALRMILLMAILASVFWHELGHALMARRLGIPTRDIMLTPICGLARLEGRPRKAWHETAIALAGPLANLLVSLVCCLAILLSGGEIRPPEQLFYDSFVRDLMWINALLFALNLCPIYPMDGGRVLRATLAGFLSHELATSIAVRFGQVLAVAVACWAAYHRQWVILIIAVMLFGASQLALVATTRANQADSTG